MAEYNKIGKGHAIGEYTHEDGSKTTMYESITGLVDLSLSGNTLTLKYKGEDLVEQTYFTDFSGLVPNSSISSGAYDPATNTVTLTKADGTTVSFVINELTSLTLAGAELTFTDENGTANKIDLTSAIKLAETVTVLKTFSLTGNVITLIYTDEDGVDQQKTVDLSSLTPGSAISGISNVDPATGEITITKFDGTEFKVKVDALTSLAFNGTTGLTFTDETGTVNTVDLKTLVQNAETDTSVSGTITTGHEIGKFVNEAGTNFSIQETITSIANFSLNAGNNTILLDFNKEDGTVQQLSLDLSTLAIDTIASIEVDTTTPGGPWLVITNSNGSEDTVKLSDVFDTINHTLSSSGNTLTSVVGGTTETADIINSVSASITSAANLQLNVNGITSSNLDLTPAIKDAETDTVIQNTVVGHKIADYTNEAGVVKDINETVTVFNAFFDDLSYLFTLTYVDENGATTTKELNLKVLAPLIIKSTVVTNETGFHKDDGTITITADGGREPFEYSKDGGVTFQSSNVFTNVVAGTYTIVVKNANGDSKSVVVAVTQPDDLVVTATSTNETSFDANNGTITAASTGGVAPITYSIDGVNYQASPLFTGVVAGVYTVYGKDSVGDIHTTSVTITQPADLTLTLISSTNESSFDANNGTITVLASGGVGAYSYSIDNGVTWQSSGTFNNLVAGTYTVLVKDQATPTNDTATVTNIVITQPADLTLTLTSQTNETAFDQNNGTIIVTAAGGVGSYQYSKDGGITWQASNIFTNLVAGTYSIMVKDQATPTIDTATVSGIVITQPDDLVAVLVSTANETAFDANNGIVVLSQTGGVGPFTYSKDGVNFQSSATFTGLTAGSYTFTVKDSSGDTSTVTTTITEPADLTVGSASVTNETAFDANDGTITLTASGGVAPYQYSIDGGVTFQSSPTFTGLQAGSYTCIIKDSSGDTATTSVTLTQPADLGINLNSKTNETVSGLNDGTINVSGVNGVPGYTYSKDGVNYQSSGIFTNLAPGNYTVYVKDSSGDTASTIVSISAGIVITTTTTTATPTVPITLNLTDLAFWRGCNGTNNGWFADLKFEATYTNAGGSVVTALLTDGPGIDSPQTIYAKIGTNVSLVATISDTDPIPTYCCKTYQVYVEEGGADLATGNLVQSSTPLAAGSATASYSFTASATRTFTAYARQTSDDANCGGGGSVTTTTTSGGGEVTTTTTTGTVPAAPASFCGDVQITNYASNATLLITPYNPGTGTNVWSECVNNGFPLGIGEQMGYSNREFDNTESMQVDLSQGSATVYIYVNDVNILTSTIYNFTGGLIHGPSGVGIGQIVKILVVQNSGSGGGGGGSTTNPVSGVFSVGFYDGDTCDNAMTYTLYWDDNAYAGIPYGTPLYLDAALTDTSWATNNYNVIKVNNDEYYFQGGAGDFHVGNGNGISC